MAPDVKSVASVADESGPAPIREISMVYDTNRVCLQKITDLSNDKKNGIL